MSQGVNCAVDCAVTPQSVPWDLWLISQAPGRVPGLAATPAADLTALAFFCGLRPGEIWGPPLGRL